MNRFLLKLATMVKRSKKPAVFSSVIKKMTPEEEPKHKHLIQQHYMENEVRTESKSAPTGDVTYE
jgi:hypothetical protein